MKTPINQLFFLTLMGIVLALGASTDTPKPLAPQLDEEAYVWDLLEKLGKDKINTPKDIDGASAEKGRELMYQGYTSSPKGKKTKRVSKHFTCNACHNAGAETADISQELPADRLKYAQENNLPFLQASTFWGMVNREHYYNDDYQKKYGGVWKIKEANEGDLRAAVQICAQYCSSGRRLEEWELESVLKYLWTLQFKVKDMKLNVEEKALLNKGLEKEEHRKEAVELLQSKYMLYNPAHNPEVKKHEEPSTALRANKMRHQNGKAIYELGCQHCHSQKRFSLFELDNQRSTFQYLYRMMKQNRDYGLYSIVRHGTYPIPGKRAYMPYYTTEKMSEEQLQDLAIYIINRAKGNQPN